MVLPEGGAAGTQVEDMSKSGVFDALYNDDPWVDERPPCPIPIFILMHSES